MSIIEAGHAQEVRKLAVQIKTEIEVLMSDPTEYLEKGYWTFIYSDNLNAQIMMAKDNIIKEACDWICQWLNHYGWKWNAAHHILPIDCDSTTN